MLSPRKERNQLLKTEVQKLLNQGNAQTQNIICDLLNKKGLNVNQSTISRVLRQIGAVKTKNNSNEVVYCLPKESVPPSTQSPLTNLILDVQKNDHLIVAHTSPGAAALIARILDHNLEKIEAIGVLAGDDTIFIAPKDSSKITKTHLEVCRILQSL